MFNITDYIQEKLHLTKDYVADSEFAKGDTIGMITIYNAGWYSVFMLCEPVTFLSQEGNNICYTKNYKKVSVNKYENGVWINSHGYYECKDAVDDKIIHILLNKKETLKLLEKLKSTDTDINKLVHEYLDKSDSGIKNVRINGNQLPINELENLYNETDK